MSETAEKKQPPVILCIGMAGSGKTTFMQVTGIIKLVDLNRDLIFK
jgi:polynucleotide 5'-kinase involved in rRNA processing